MNYLEKKGLKYLKYFMSIIITNFTLLVYGQYSEVIDFIPPGPEASSMQKFTDVPVSLYTGIPDITIPLYTIEIDGVAVPIFISYHASGIRVKQEASYIGLGWSLFAGGQITREVRGKEDFNIDSYYFDPYLPIDKDNLALFNYYYRYSNKCIDTEYPDNTNNFPCEPFPITDPDFYYIMQEFNAHNFQMQDIQPDIFTGSFLSHNLKFLFEQETGNPFFLGKLDSKYDIAFIDDNEKEDGFVITDSKGVKYTFEINGRSGYDPLGDIDKTEITSWSLTKITTLNDREINFDYDYPIVDTISSSTQKKLKWKAASGCSLPGSLTDAMDEYLNNSGTQNFNESLKTSEKGISEISFDGGRIVFYASDREDKYGKKLDEINVINSNNEVVKQIVFTYSYFLSEPIDNNNRTKRLKLENIKINDEPPYVFSYNAQKLPSKRSLAYDHWGYYNGEDDNESVMPLIKSNVWSDVGSSNRSPVEQYAKAAVLEKITYPTGGYAKYNFELNTFNRLYSSGPIEKTVNLGNSQEETVSITVEEDYKQMDNLVIEYNCTSTNGFPDDSEQWSLLIAAYECLTKPELECADWGQDILDSYDMTLEEVEDYINDVPSITISSLNQSYNPMIINSFGTEAYIIRSETGTLNYELPSGSYNITIKSPSTTTVQVAILHNEDLVGGGLRVKSTELYDPSSDKTIVKDYIYGVKDDEGHELRSYGKQTVPVKYYSTYLLNSIILDNCGTQCGAYIFECNSNGMFSNNSNPLVGYDTVIVKNNNDIDIGYEAFYYINETTGFPNFQPFPFPVNIENGLLKGKDVIDASGGLVQTVRNVYLTKSNNYYNGYRIFSHVNIPSPGPNNSGCNLLGYGNDNNYFAICPEFNNGIWIVKNTETVTDYFNNSEIQNVTEYFYDNVEHKLPTKIKTSDSDGKIFITKYKYPQDYLPDVMPEPPTIYHDESVLFTMLQRNMIGMPIEIIQEKDNKIIGSKISKYDVFPYVQNYSDITDSHLILPKEQYELEITEPIDESSFAESDIIYQPSFIMDGNYSLKATMDMYDDKGNLLQYHTNQGNNISYIYGYDKTLPIAKVNNAKHIEIAYVGFEDENDLDEFTYVGSIYTDGGKKGDGYLQMSGSASITSKSLPAGDYKLEFWAQGTVTVSGGTVTSISSSSPDANGWTYYEKSMNLTSTGSVQFDGTTFIDEIRLYPMDAQMTSYTYKPLIGITTQTDARGYTTYYEYDDSGRLERIKGNDGNIVEEYKYKYKNSNPN